MKLILLGVALLVGLHGVVSDYQMKESLYYRNNNLDMVKAKCKLVREIVNKIPGLKLALYLAEDACQCWEESTDSIGVDDIVELTRLTRKYRGALEKFRCIDEYAVRFWDENNPLDINNIKTPSVESILKMFECTHEEDIIFNDANRVYAEQLLEIKLFEARFDEDESESLIRIIEQYAREHPNEGRTRGPFRKWQTGHLTGMSGRQDSSRPCDGDPTPPRLQGVTLRCDIDALDIIDSHYKCQYRVDRNHVNLARGHVMACIKNIPRLCSSRQFGIKCRAITEPMWELLEAVGVIGDEKCPSKTSFFRKNKKTKKVFKVDKTNNLIAAIRDGKLRGRPRADLLTGTDFIDGASVAENLIQFAGIDLQFKQKLWEVCSPLSKADIEELEWNIINVKRALPLLFRILQSPLFVAEKDFMRDMLTRFAYVSYTVFFCNILSMADFDGRRIMLRPNHEEFARGWITDFQMDDSTV